MSRLLCRLGIHAPTWHPLLDSTGCHELGWLQLRVCLYCGHHMRRRAH